jgi:hypothetical protein
LYGKKAFRTYRKITVLGLFRMYTGLHWLGALVQPGLESAGRGSI